MQRLEFCALRDVLERLATVLSLEDNMFVSLILFWVILISSINMLSYF